MPSTRHLIQTAEPAAAANNTLRQQSSLTGALQQNCGLPSFWETFVAVDAGSLKIKEVYGCQGTIFQIRLYQTVRKKAATNAFQKIVNQFGAVVDLKRELVQGREKFTDKLSHLLKRKIAEQVVEGRKLFLADRRTLADAFGQGYEEQTVCSEKMAVVSGFLKGLISEDQIKKPILQGLKKIDRMTDDKVDGITVFLLQHILENRSQIAFVNGAGGADAQGRPGKSRRIQFLYGQFFQVQDTPCVIEKDDPFPGQGNIFLASNK